MFNRDISTAEHRFRTMVEKTTDGIVIVDKNGILKFANPAAKRIFNRKFSGEDNYLFGFPIVKDEVTEIEIGSNNASKTTAEMRVVEIEWEGETAYLAAIRDITERIEAEKERMELINDLQEALKQVQILSGFLPICSVCKKIRDDAGYWQQVEAYISKHSDVIFSHSICPECAKKLYSDYLKKNE